MSCFRAFTREYTIAYFIKKASIYIEKKPDHRVRLLMFLTVLIYSDNLFCPRKAGIELGAMVVSRRCRARGPFGPPRVLLLAHPNRFFLRYLRRRVPFRRSRKRKLHNSKSEHEKGEPSDAQKAVGTPHVQSPRIISISVMVLVIYHKSNKKQISSQSFL